MPICGRLKRVLRSDDGGSARFRVYLHSEAHQFPPFEAFLAQQLRGWKVSPSREGRKGRYLDITSPSEVGGTAIDRCQQMLKRWQKTVTIQDEADESHALGLHHWYTEDGNREKTDLGQKMDRVRNPNPQISDIWRAKEAKKIATLYCDWLELHPAYAQCDLVVPAPAHDPSKTFQLPVEIACHIAQTHNIRLCFLNTTARVSHQNLDEHQLPTVKEVADSITAPTEVQGRTVFLIDDVYRSGRTIEGTAQALRAAGASQIYALTATKTAKFCNGLPPQREYWFTGGSG